MEGTKIYKVSASINVPISAKTYIAIENNNGILLVNKGLFVISFDDERQIPLYKREKLLAEL